MILTKLATGPTQKETPGDHDLEVINRYALEPGTLTAADVFVGRVKLCNDQYDKAHERFTKEILDRFAETTPGKPVLRGHNTRQEPAGKFFDAEVIRDDKGVHHVVARYYLAASDALTAKVKAGIVKDVSIGATAVQRTCDVCGHDFDTEACKHMPGVEYDGRKCTVTYSGDPQGYETREGSFVVEGCQYGAETIRAVDSVERLNARKAQMLQPSFADRVSEDMTNALIDRMLTFEVSGQPRGAAGLDFQTSSGTQSRKEQCMDPIQKAAEPEALSAEKAVALTSERDTLLKWKTENEPLVGDGRAYRERLKKEITRLGGVTKLEAFAAIALQTADTAPIASLEAVEQQLTAKANEMLGGRGDGIPADPKHEIPTAPTAPFDPHRPHRPFWRAS